MNTKHTPEPWRDLKRSVVGPIIGIYDQDGGLVAKLANRPQSKANAERITACVNACQGINPAAVPKVLRALERLLNSVEPDSAAKWEDGSEVMQARAALALARSEA